MWLANVPLIASLTLRGGPPVWSATTDKERRGSDIFSPGLESLELES